jgi:ankyrin repeat protein
VVRALVESAADVQHTNHKGTPPLHFALYCEMPEEKRADMVKILLDSGADATAVDDSGLSGEYVCMCQIILQNRFFSFLADEYHCALALHVACRDGQDEIINLLLEQKGVDPNCQDIHGHTPLYYADESRKELTAKLLSA